MPIVPIRNLAKYGVLTDPDPYDLPTEAWSMGVNVRFRNEKVTRGPVFRNVHALATANPRFVVGSFGTTGQDNVFLCYRNGTIFKYQTGTETAYSIAGYTPSDAEATWTTARLADVVYINRSDRPPWYLRSIDAQFQNLSLAAGSSPWQATWTAQILRSASNGLIAYNVTKSGTNFPTMVKTSSFPLSSTVPDSWDQTVANSNATENILSEMEGPIIDAFPLYNDMFIYGSNETWFQQFVGGQNIWDYRRVYTGRGVINANCVVEVNGEHYIFGVDDIWKHNGIQPISICDGRTREFIFSGLDQSKSTRCFVVHNASLKEIMFCYVSGDRVTKFSGADGCNRAATYSYQDDKWTFDDQPFVFSGARANLDTTLTYATVTQTYVTIGGSYQDQQDTLKRNTVFVGDVNSTFSLTASFYAFDPVGPLSQVSSPVDMNASGFAYLERDGIDLDQLGVELRGYKLLKSLYPQGRLDPNAQPLEFAIGGADFFNQTATFTNFSTWDGQSLYKLDYNEPGRFLAMHVLFPDFLFMSFSGYDADLDVTGER
jgi:hypothetical protein